MGNLFSDLVLHAKCNDDTASDVVTDSSLQANHGTLENDNTEDVTTAGKIDKAFLLDSRTTSHIVAFPDIPAYDIATELSVCLWFYHITNSGTSYFIGKFATADREWSILHYDAHWWVGVSGNGTSWTWSSDFQTSPTPGLWYHMGFTFDNGVLKVYWDGEVSLEESMAVSSLYQGSEPIRLCPGGNNPQIQVDDVRVYKRVLSPGEFTSIYNGGNGTEFGHVVSGGGTFFDAAGWAQGVKS